MNFDEMDIEPKDEGLYGRNSPPLEMTNSSKQIGESDDEELETEFLTRTVPLEDGCIGYVFTCTKNGPLKTWRCHVCNFVDTWSSLLKHIDTSRHTENMTKFRHSKSNFTKIENAIPDISKGQPLPPGMEDEYTGPCYILKSLETFEQPLIGLEFLLELHVVDLKEPRYLCLLCDKRGDPRSILVHLTSQNHYMLYLRKYFRKFHSLIDQLPKSNECRSNVAIVTSHLIAKLEEKYGRLQPTATHDVLSSPEQRAVILQKADHGEHFTESPDDAHLEAMLTIDYVQNTTLLLKDFPLKPKAIKVDKVEKKTEENSKSLFNKSSKPAIKKQLRNRDGSGRSESREKSPDVVFVGSQKPLKSDYKDRPDRYRERSPRSHSRHRSRSTERGSGERRRYVSPSCYRSLRYHHSRSRSRSPRRYRSRSPDFERDRFGRRISPHSKYSSRYHYSPDRHRRSPSPRSLYHRSKDRSRSRSPRGRDRSPRPRSRRSGSRSRSGTRPGPDSSDKVSSTVKEKFEGGPKFAYLRELKEVEKRLKKELEQYTETAEDHPAYQDEWKKFWCARYKELADEGKEDPRKYDYKPEWITFWNVRIKQLHEEELEKQKKMLKAKYAIENEPVKSKKSADRPTSSSEDNRPVVDIKTMWKELTGCEIRENSSSKRKSLSPWEEDNDEENDGKDDASEHGEKKSRNTVAPDDRSTQPISPKSLSPISDTESLDGKSPLRRGGRSPRSRSFSKSRSRSPPSFFSHRPHPLGGEVPRKKKIHFENPLNIITVLRQLSVLEYQLGSYSGHVVSLLSSGLAMERIKPQSSVDLLTKENVIFLELVKEKLKGQLLAGVVQKSMVKATLFCIKNIEELLLLVPKLKPTAPPPVPQPPPSLLYGTAAAEPYPGAAPPTAPSLSYGSHVYGGGYPYKQHTPRPYKPYSDRYPVRKSPPRRPEGSGERYHSAPNRYPFRPETPFKDAPKDRHAAGTSSGPSLPSDDINKALIAGQIAEALEQQGRTDVSEEELSILVNTVVESLQSGKKGSGLIGDILGTSSSSVSATTSAATSVIPPKVPEVPTIPVGFNVNDVPSATLALLQDAFKNAALAVEKPFSIEELPESELIQLLRNFKSIPRMKQEKLIEYLRKLEDTNPERVEELKKYVNVL